MTWSDAHLAKLEAGTYAPIFVLEFVDGTSYGATGVGDAYKIASHPNVYGADEITIAEGGIRTGSCSVTPGTWNYTAGAWTVDITGNASALLNHVTRGSLARLVLYWDIASAAAGMPGTGMSIALGVLQGISGRPPRYTLQFWDIIAAMAGRRDTDTHDTRDNEQCSLFWRTAFSTTLQTAYQPGDGAMVLDNVTDFETVTSGSSVVKVEPTGGDPFYVSYENVNSGPKTLTVLTDDIHGTTSVNSAANDTAIPCAWLAGSPGDIVMRILTSTGTGANGAHDVYPASWGFGIPYTWLDESNINEWSTAIIQLTKSTGTAAETYWSTIIDEPVENPASWLASFLSASGVWLVTRHGEISIRCCQDPHGSDLVDAVGARTAVSRGPILSGITINNNDIVEIVNHDLFDSQVSFEAGRHRVAWYDTSETPEANPRYTWNVADALTVLGTFPGVASVTVDLSDRLYDTDADKADGADYRLKSWVLRVPETIELRCAGLRLAQLVPGDLVSVTTDRIVGRPDPRAQFYTRRICMVSSVSVNWTNSAVDLTLSFLPEGNTT